MSWFDDFLQKISPSPGTEKVLSALPQLLGAFESARGRPIGAPLSMLGQFGDVNAKNRETSGNANALNQLVQTFNPQDAPIANSLYKQFQPSMDQMTPDARMAELQNIQQVGEKEQLKTDPADKLQFKALKDGRIFTFDPTTGETKERKDLEGQGGPQNPLSSPWKAFSSNDPAAQQKARDYFDLQKANQLKLMQTETPIREASGLDEYSRKKDIDAAKIGLKPASSQGLVPIDANGVPRAGGSIADAQANGALAKADVAPYQEADKAVQSINRLAQQATQLNAKAPTMFPKNANLLTASGDISIPVLKRLAPNLYDPMQASVSLLADQVAKSQIGGRAQQSAMQLQLFIRNPHSTLTSMLETLNKVKDAMEDEKRARLARGKNQTDASWNRLMMQTTGVPYTPEGATPAPTSTAPSIPLKGSF